MNAASSPRLLVVAGHDSSGRAGVDADRQAATAAGADVRVVVTAWTKQDPTGVRELGAVDPERWLAEALEEAAWNPRAVKLGLLPGSRSVEAAADLVATLRRSSPDLPVVLDPVIAASSGRRFLDREALVSLRTRLLPLGLVITPNLPEAAELCAVEGARLAGAPEARIEAAEVLIAAGVRAVLMKGGHGDEDPVRDLVAVAGADPLWLTHPRVPGGGIGGSGCRYASAVAARLAGGWGIEEAARWAGEWVADRVREGG